MKKFFNIYRNILLVMALLIAAVMLVPLLFQIKPFVVLSGSMEPTLGTGSVCYIKPYSESEKPEVGEIAAFLLNDNETLIVHRIVDKQGENYITQGDANDSVDMFTPTEKSFTGHAVFVVPYLGYAVSWLQSSRGIIVAVVLVLISIVSSFLDDEKASNKKKKETSEIIIEPNTEIPHPSQSLSEIIKKEKKVDILTYSQDIFDEGFKEISPLDSSLISNEEVENGQNVKQEDFKEAFNDNKVNFIDIAKDGLNQISQAHFEDVENEGEGVYDISEYVDTYLDKRDNNENNTEDEDSPESLLLDINDWGLLVEDTDSEFLKKYRESVMRSIKRKLDEVNDETDCMSLLLSTKKRIGNLLESD